jgi:hypothetical protein
MIVKVARFLADLTCPLWEAPRRRFQQIALELITL